MKAESNDIIKELIAKSLAGETTAEQELQLQKWLQSDSENQKYYESVRKVSQLVEDRFAIKESKNIEIDLDAEWNTFINRIDHERDSVFRPEPKDTSNSLWLKIAAGLLILVTASFGINYLFSRNGVSTYQTAAEIKTITLPDGSTVTLNKYSKLTHDEDFSEENRSLSFSGEAFFDVTSNPKLPFIIKLKTAEIEVVGTSFNVLAYDSIDIAEVTVKTGVVKFSSVKTGKAVKLSAGKKGTYTEKELELVSAENTDVNFLSWSTRKISFNETDLKIIVSTLNKVYNANIILAADVSDSCVVTANFEGQPLESVLRVLESTLNLTYSVQDDSIIITGAGC